MAKLWLILPFGIETTGNAPSASKSTQVGKVGHQHYTVFEALATSASDGSFEVLIPENAPPTVDKYARRKTQHCIGSNQGHIAESLTVPVRFDTISEQKRDETKPTSPTHCL